jgi:hypothetical protein
MKYMISATRDLAPLGRGFDWMTGAESSVPNMTSNQFDVVVLGTGAAVLTAAIRAAGGGASVGLFETPVVQMRTAPSAFRTATRCRSGRP